jgi:hypothetical protein
VKRCMGLHADKHREGCSRSFVKDLDDAKMGLHDGVCSSTTVGVKVYR